MKLSKSQLSKITQPVVRAANRFTLFTSNGDMSDIIKMIESLENSGLLVDDATETVKHKTKNKKVDFLGLWWELWLLH